MLTVTLHDRPLSAWVPATAGNAARARFMRHHLHFLRCTEEAFFTDEKAGAHLLDTVHREFSNLLLLDLPEGVYTLHGGDGELYQLAVTPIMVCLEGVKIIDIPDRSHRDVPAEHVTRMVPLKSTDRVVHVWTHQRSVPPPGGTYISVDLHYEVLLKAADPTNVDLLLIGYQYLGTLDLDTGAIIT